MFMEVAFHYIWANFYKITSLCAQTDNNYPYGHYLGSLAGHVHFLYQKQMY